MKLAETPSKDVPDSSSLAAPVHAQDIVINQVTSIVPAIQEVIVEQIAQETL
jgi:hypothetical protein